jgi:hypothetical protein
VDQQEYYAFFSLSQKRPMIEIASCCNVVKQGIG